MHVRRCLAALTALTLALAANPVRAETPVEHPGSAVITWEFYIHDPSRVSPAGVGLFLRPGGGVLASADNGHVYAVSASGQSIGEFSTPEPDHFTRADSYASGRIVVGSYSGKVHCLDQNARVLWSCESRPSTEAATATACFGPDGSVYLAEDNGDVSIRDPNGNFVTRFQSGKDLSAWGPSLDGAVICTNEESILLVSENSGVGNCLVSCYDMSGKERWDWTLPGNVMWGFACAPDGTVYAVDHGDAVYALNPDGTQRWKWSNQDPLEPDDFHYYHFAMAPNGDAFIASDHQFVGFRPDGTELTRQRFDGDGWPILVGAYGSVYVRISRKIGEDAEGIAVYESELQRVFGGQASSWKIDSGLINFAGPGEEGEFYAVYMNFADDANPVTIARIDLKD